MNYIDKLENLEACEEAVEWCKGYPTLKAAWDNCERGDWMAWLVPRCNYGPKRRGQFLLALLEIARTVEHLHPEAKQCNDVLEQYLHGEATEEELRTAADAADAAVNAADAAAYAAYAADAAAYAAYAAADAANAAADAANAAADAAARTKSLKNSADIICKHVACPKL